MLSISLAGVAARKPCTAALKLGRPSASRTRAGVIVRVRASHQDQEAASPQGLHHPTAGPHACNYHHPTPPSGYQFFMPTVSLLGPGALQTAGKEMHKMMREQGLQKGLVITDQELVKSGAIKTLHQVLVDNGVAHTLYAGVTPNPTVAQVEEGVRVVKERGCDFLISFGGGSSHDCAKAIGIVATNGGSIKDYEGVDKSTKPMLPLIAVNTTAGTAAEMTRFAVITDTDRHIKMAVIDSKCTPSIAVDDPVLTAGMPPGLTAATGMDALTHSIEAYVSTASNPITDACALHAMRLISTYLREAVDNPQNLQARDMMMYAQYLAGMAFNSASLGYVHALAHQLGGLYNLPHGVCNAVLLPVVEEFNAQACPELFVDMAEALACLDSGKGGASAGDAVQAVIAAIRQLASDVGIPRSLKELGVRPEDFATLAEHAQQDACRLTNPREASREELVELLRRAYEQG